MTLTVDVEDLSWRNSTLLRSLKALPIRLN
jgi:hypothetical protein